MPEQAAQAAGRPAPPPSPFRALGAEVGARLIEEIDTCLCDLAVAAAALAAWHTRSARVDDLRHALAACHTHLPVPGLVAGCEYCARRGNVVPAVDAAAADAAASG